MRAGVPSEPDASGGADEVGVTGGVVGNDGAGVVPSTMSIEFVQAMKTGSVDDFLSAIEYWERKQSMAILGGTLTSQADGKTSTAGFLSGLAGAIPPIHELARNAGVELPAFLGKTSDTIASPASTQEHSEPQSEG